MTASARRACACSPMPRGRSTPDVWVVAPERKWTAASHQLSFDRVLDADARRGEREYACSGAPADCVVAAMTRAVCGRAEARPRAGGSQRQVQRRGRPRVFGHDGDRARGDLLGRSRDRLSRRRLIAFPATAQVRCDRRASLRVLWDGRAAWSGPGHWLSLNLPARLPAPLVQARVGRDKIGAACEMLESTAESIDVSHRSRPSRHARSRRRARGARRGRIALVRHRWLADAADSGRDGRGLVGRALG